MTKRIQLRRTKGWRLPEGAVSVARPTKWGNPFGYRQHTGLARTPAVDGDGEWEYEGRISADGARHDYHHPDGRITVCHVRYMTRAEVVETFRLALLGQDTPAMRAAFPSGRGKWLGRWVGRGPDRHREYVTVEDVRRELAGRDLACWCPLTEPCHADVLLEIANEGAINA
jgi:Domain of unknown function (DUF4326)